MVSIQEGHHGFAVLHDPHHRHRTTVLVSILTKAVEPITNHDILDILSHRFFSVAFSYIDIIQAKLETTSEIFKYNFMPNKKNIMAKMLVNGTPFASANTMPKKFGTLLASAFDVSRCSISTYDDFAAAILL
jgi:hypothetical protein